MLYRIPVLNRKLLVGTKRGARTCHQAATALVSTRKWNEKQISG
jgi:hypothetical protein